MAEPPLTLNRFQTDDIAAANALLLSRENALNPPGLHPDSPAPETKPEPAERQAAPETAEKPANTNPLPADTPAAPERAAASPQKETPPPNNGDTGKGSAFARDAQRRDTSWKALNAEKQQADVDRRAIQAERVKLQEEQRRFQQQQQGASKNRLTPETYEQSAAAQEKFVSDAALQLDGLRARKARFEEAGQYTEAAKLDSQIEQMQEQVAVAKYQARQFKEIAANMRQNPDVTGEALKKQNEQHLQHYTVEACKRWPELAQAGSEFQKAVARGITVLRQSGLDENDHPALRFFVAEHVAAQSAAARVPVMEKELVQARARIKELESLTAPGGGTSAQPNLRPGTKPQSLEAEGDSLRLEAQSRGAKG